VVSKQTIFAVTAIFPLSLVFLSFLVHEEPRARSEEGEESEELTPRMQAKRIADALRRKEIWGPMLFVFLLMIAPSSQSAFFFFLTNDLKLEPSFMGTLSLVEGVSSLLGLTFYNVYLKKFSYRKILKVSIFLSIIAGATPLILILHVNRKWGISDRWFCIGDTAVLAAIGQISLMPLLVLGAETCPPNIEATLYSFLMSTLNVGALLSTQLGGLMTYLLGVTSTDFHNLWLLCLICNMCTICIIPFIVLVPAEKSDGVSKIPDEIPRSEETASILESENR
jgi:predicted MFS family arabinose efflux permease